MTGHSFLFPDFPHRLGEDVCPAQRSEDSVGVAGAVSGSYAAQDHRGHWNYSSSNDLLMWKMEDTWNSLNSLSCSLPTSFAHRTSVEERRTVSATSVPLAGFPYK